MRPGLPGSSSQGLRAPGISRFETLKPVRPALGLPPRPVAPSSRISPPEPVAAPAVDRPVGVEDLVAAVFGVRLGEHHQLDVGRVAAKGGEVVDEVVDLVGGEREAERDVGGGERGGRLGAERDRAQRSGRTGGREDDVGVGDRDHRLRHPVGEGVIERDGIGDPAARAPRRAALDAADRGQARGVRDVGRLRRPRRDRAQPRHHQPHLPGVGGVALAGTAARAVGEQAIEECALVVGQLPIDRDDMEEAGRERGDPGVVALDPGQHRGPPRRRARRRASDHQDQVAPSTAAIRATGSPAIGTSAVPVSCW